MLKHKRLLLIAFAVVFLALLFFLKNKSLLINKENYTNQTANQGGLAYNNAIIGDLVNRDTDRDGVLDWEESLWGTDPTKKETTPGTPDNVVIDELKKQQNITTGTNNQNQNEASLTQTDKFSRELFATLAALNQNGAMDQATADKISSSLADQIQNSPQRKIFGLADIKVVKDSSKNAIQNYRNTLSDLYRKYPTNGNVLDIFKKAINNEDDSSLNATVLSELDPIIKSKQAYIEGVLKVNVPEILLSSHLGVLNALERLVENLEDIELVDSDVILAFSAISQYQDNFDSLDSALKNLTGIMNQKLNN